jgi:chromosome segregation ATPase
MKTTARIFMLATILALAGSLTIAWGAESVASLITQGEAAISKTNAAKAALDAVVKENTALAPEGKQIRDDMQQLQNDIAAMNKQNDDLKQQTIDYKAKCDGKQLSTDQYKACKDQLNQINAAINNINTQPAKLKKRQDDIMARANKYNQRVQSLPKQISDDDTAYRNALVTQLDWLDKTRTLILTPAFQPYAKKAGCPDVKNPAKSTEAAINMSDEVLACLKKVAESN